MLAEICGSSSHGAPCGRCALVVPRVKYSERRRDPWRLLLRSTLFFDGESFINEYSGAWGGTDLDRIMSYYAENVALQIPGLLMEGKEALREQFVRPFITAFLGNRHLVNLGGTLWGPH